MAEDSIWALYRPDGSLYCIGMHSDEADAWHIALGWPATTEIDKLKTDGYRMVRVTIAEAAEIEKLRASLAVAEAVIEFYADPESYHAVAFMADPPAGGFADDFDQEHGHEDYPRPMPGKRAREYFLSQQVEGEVKP